MTTTNNPESHTWQCEQVETLTSTIYSQSPLEKFKAYFM